MTRRRATSNCATQEQSSAKPIKDVRGLGHAGSALQTIWLLLQGLQCCLHADTAYLLPATQLTAQAMLTAHMVDACSAAYQPFIH